jgi:hypothetical protein
MKIVWLTDKILIFNLIIISFSVLGIILPTSLDISALSSKTITGSEYDTHERYTVRWHEPTHAFAFVAYNICSEKYEQCFDIWGQGNYNHEFNEVTGQGNYEKYKEKPGIVMESSWWRADDFISASDTHVVFRAQPAVTGPGVAGFIVIQVFEGKTSDTGRICVYGNLFDKQYPSSEAEADCTNDAFVKIEPAG